nr:NAD-dependent protein deacylase SRT2-like isoform X2 [Erigeron canadensis]
MVMAMRCKYPAGKTSFKGCVKYVQTMSQKPIPDSLKKVVPDSNPVTTQDVNRLYDFFARSKKLVVLTGAGVSTECGIPDYRSPHGAYSTGYKPMQHQDFISSGQVRNRYWVKSYPLWMKFHEAKPGPAHTALASLEKANRISFMITQNIDRLHHLAGSNPLELHGTVHFVTCLDCGFSFPRESFQDIVRLLNPKWTAAIESLDSGSNPDQSSGMKRRPNGDIEVDESFWDDLNVPTCSKCDGVLKPDVVFFGDNIPMDKVDMAMDAAEGCDAFLVLGSSLETMLPTYLVQ